MPWSHLLLSTSQPSSNLKIWIAGYPNGPLAKFPPNLKLKSQLGAMAVLYDGNSSADQRMFMRNTEIGWKELQRDSSNHSVEGAIAT